MGIQLASPESVIPESGPIIDIQNVTYTYWNRKKPTLNDVSIQIPRGKLTVIVGPGDSGKSTLCNLFNGVIPHLLEGQLKGNVFVNGVNTRSMPVGKHSRIVGRVFQDADSMFATLFVDDEIAFGPENFCFEPETIRKEVDRLIKEVDLLEHCHNLVWQLSGGQIQKLALACVLAVQPAVVVLDEPTANLDPDTTRKVNRMVLEMRNQGTTVVLISRELDEYLAHADQLIILNQGRVAAAGMPKNVLGDHGDFLINELGVWLPETSDVAIRLNRSGALHKKIDIPISVNDTVNAIKQIVVKEATRSHFTEPAVVKTEAECPKGEVVISARDLHYQYLGGIQALRGISFDIRAGELIAIVGRNGAGKSTLSKLLVGLLKPQQGELTLFGKPARSWKAQDLTSHISLVFQNPEHQFLTDTVKEEIEYSLLAKGITEPEEVKRQTIAYLEQLDLLKEMEIHPLALSAGKKRRLGVATMLVGNPQFLIVDEPTYGQDKHMTITMMDLLESLNAKGIGIIMVTHDMRLIHEYCERVIVMTQGQITYDGSTNELFAQEKILKDANLRTTLLHEIVLGLETNGVALKRPIRNTQQLTNAILEFGIGN